MSRIFGRGKDSLLAQMTARPLPLPEDLGLNPAIGNFYRTYLLLTVCINDKNKEKEAGNSKGNVWCRQLRQANILKCCLLSGQIARYRKDKIKRGSEWPVLMQVLFILMVEHVGIPQLED